MTNTKQKVAIFGGSGYGGSELLRILLQHPFAEVLIVTANEQAEKRVGEVHRNLNGLTDLVFERQPEDLSSLKGTDVVFLALPHGKAMDLAPSIPDGVKVIDLSGDFRLEDASAFESFYGFEHRAMEVQKDFAYGLTEVNRETIKGAAKIANPGCFATSILLAVYPLAEKGIVEDRIIVDAKTGSSGSGVKPAANTHHPERMNSFYAYKPFTHQHLPEIARQLGGTVTGGQGLTMMTHSLPVSRGIFASCYLKAKEDVSAEEIASIFEDSYADSFFVRIVDGSPNINWVKMTNFCDISVHVNGREIAVFSAIDNLVKGAAGQAVQNMNLMCGLPENTGLMHIGGRP